MTIHDLPDVLGYSYRFSNWAWRKFSNRDVWRHWKELTVHLLRGGSGDGGPARLHAWRGRGLDGVGRAGRPRDEGARGDAGHARHIGHAHRVAGVQEVRGGGQSVGAAALHRQLAASRTWPTRITDTRSLWSTNKITTKRLFLYSTCHESKDVRSL